MGETFKCDTGVRDKLANKGQTIAKLCESNALFTKVGKHSRETQHMM